MTDSPLAADGGADTDFATVTPDSAADGTNAMVSDLPTSAAVLVAEAPSLAEASAPEDVPRRRKVRIHPLAALRTLGRPPRIMGLDVARGLAIVGMAAAHMADAPTLEWTDPSTWFGVVHGRSSILFALLAGISTALITGRQRRPERAELPRLRLRLLGRGAAIFVIGLVLEVLGTMIAIILCVYGLLFIAAIPFLRWRPRNLMIAAATLAIAGPFLLSAIQVFSLYSYGEGSSLALFGTYPTPVWMAFMLAGLAIGRMRFTRAFAAVAMVSIGIGLAVIGYAGGTFADEKFGPNDADWKGSSYLDPDGSGTDSGDVPVDSKARPGSAESAPDGMAPDAAYGSGPEADVVLDEWGYVEVPLSELGDWLDQSGLDESTTMCNIWVGSGLDCWANSGEPSDEDGGWIDPEEMSYWDRIQESDPWPTIVSHSIAVDPHSGGTFEIIGSGGFVIAVVGLCLLISRPLRWLLLPVACLGMMPLTSYTAHVLVFCFAAGGPSGFLNTSVGLWLWSTAALVVGASLWAVLFGRGPLERAVAWTARRTERA